MGIVFAVRGDQINARYAPGGAAPFAWGSTPPVSNTAQAGINGTNSIDFSGSVADQRGLCYYGKHQYPLTNELTILMRVYFDSVSINQPLFKMGIGGRVMMFGWAAYMTSSNQLRCFYYPHDLYNSPDAIFSGGSFASTGVWTDIVMRFVENTLTTGFQIYKDASLNSQGATARNVPTMANVGPMMTHTLGFFADNYSSSRWHLDEYVVWDELIDPTSVTLESGVGSLNGSSRTSYVAVSADDGSALGGGGPTRKLL